MWDFIQYQVLGMVWLNEAIGNGLSRAGVDIGTPFGGSIHFLSMM